MAGKTQEIYEGHHEIGYLADAYLGQKDMGRGGIAGEMYIGALALRKEVANFIRGGKKFTDAITSGAQSYLQRFIQSDVGSLLSKVSQVYNGPRIQALKALASHPIAYFAEAASKYSAAEDALEEAKGQKDPQVASAMAAKAVADMKKYERGATIYKFIREVNLLRLEAKYSQRIIKNRIEETLGGLEELVLGKKTELTPENSY